MKKSHPENKKAFVLLISAALLIGAFSNASGLEITVKQSVVVKGELIRLGDIAQFEPMNDKRVPQLANIEIASSPLPGTDSTINNDLLIYKINPSLSGNKDILIKLPESLVVHRTAQLINTGRMQEIFVEYVKDNSEWPEDQMRFEDISTPGTIALPEGKLRWEIQNKSNSDLTGNVSLTIDFSVDERLVKKVPVSGKVSITRETIKAGKKIARGQVIAANDITLVSEHSLHFRKEALINKEDVIGKRALRTIQADQTILSNMIENPPLVKKGDKVMIRAESLEMRIMASGEALQDGQTGEQVEVLNLQSGRKVFATVKSSGIVEVLF
jgi:flagellar basal body P-ring formation protein FlgA